MKKKLLFIVVVAVCLLSWGVTGHRTVGKIAEKHLTPAAKAAVEQLLGKETLADVSTWADEVRGQDEYKQTGSWHYINLPMGLSYPEFQKRVEGMSEDNVYSVLTRLEKEVVDPATPREKKVEDLKFIVHFIGDLHQPMHVSRAEDKGGNTVQLNFNGQGTNLHAIWDSKLIDSLGQGYEQLASTVDHATPAQIGEWQKDPMVKWMWESYAITEKLYAEVDAMKRRAIDDKYYQEHIATVEQRLEQAGIRLAGVLNGLFAHGVVVGPAAPPSAAPAEGAVVKIDAKDAQAHLGEHVEVSGKVYGFKALEGLTLVNLGAEYPNQLLTVVLRGEAANLASAIDGKVIRVTGKVEMYKGKPEIVVRDPRMVSR
jgi:hypothetical protein